MPRPEGQLRPEMDVIFVFSTKVRRVGWFGGWHDVANIPAYMSDYIGIDALNSWSTLHFPQQTINLFQVTLFQASQST